MPWIILKRRKQVRKGGVSVTYRPGDSVEVGRQTAIEWILDGSAADPYEQVGPPVLPKGPKTNKFGVRVRAEEGTVDLKGLLGKAIGRLSVSYGPPAIPFEHTLILKPTQKVSWEKVNYGFLRILSSQNLAWELAVGLDGITNLASDIGSEEERAETEKVVGDLRLPVYDTRFIWARKCPAAQRVIEEWAEQLARGADERHAFLRALYTQRAMLCTLPPDWLHR